MKKLKELSVNDNLYVINAKGRLLEEKTRDYTYIPDFKKVVFIHKLGLTSEGDIGINDYSSYNREYEIVIPKKSLNHTSFTDEKRGIIYYTTQVERDNYVKRFIASKIFEIESSIKEFIKKENERIEKLRSTYWEELNSKDIDYDNL